MLRIRQMSQHFILAAYVKCPILHSFNRFGLKYSWNQDHSNHISERLQVDFLKELKPLQISNYAYHNINAL